MQRVKRINMVSDDPISDDLENVQARAPNGNVNHLLGILLHFHVVLVSAATSDAIVQEQFAGLLPQLQFYDSVGESLFDHTMSLAAFNHISAYLERRGPQDPAAIAADSNTTHTIEMVAYIPYYLSWLRDPLMHVQPSALLTSFEGRWAAGDVWGTGQTITVASSYLDIYFDHIPLKLLDSRPKLVYGRVRPREWLDGTVPLNGRVLGLLLDDDAAGAVTTLGATDFTDLQVDGQTVGLRRQPINANTLAYNAHHQGGGDAHDGQIALPTSGDARWLPIINNGRDCKLSEVPHERNLGVSLIEGAGAPALTDHYYTYAVSRPRDDFKLAEAIGRSGAFTLTPKGAQVAVTAQSRVRGLKGVIPESSTEMGPWLPKPLLVREGLRSQRG